MNEEEDDRLLGFFEHGTLLFEEMRVYRERALGLISSMAPGAARTAALKELLQERDAEMLKVIFS